MASSLRKSTCKIDQPPSWLSRTATQLFRTGTSSNDLFGTSQTLGTPSDSANPSRCTSQQSNQQISGPSVQKSTDSRICWSAGLSESTPSKACTADSRKCSGETCNTELLTTAADNEELMTFRDPLCTPRLGTDPIDTFRAHYASPSQYQLRHPGLPADVGSRHRSALVKKPRSSSSARSASLQLRSEHPLNPHTPPLRMFESAEILLGDDGLKISTAEIEQNWVDAEQSLYPPSVHLLDSLMRIPDEQRTELFRDRDQLADVLAVNWMRDDPLLTSNCNQEDIVTLEVNIKVGARRRRMTPRHGLTRSSSMISTHSDRENASDLTLTPHYQLSPESEQGGSTSPLPWDALGIRDKSESKRVSLNSEGRLVLFENADSTCNCRGGSIWRLRYGKQPKMIKSSSVLSRIVAWWTSPPLDPLIGDIEANPDVEVMRFQYLGERFMAACPPSSDRQCHHQRFVGRYLTTSSYSSLIKLTPSVDQQAIAIMAYRRDREAGRLELFSVSGKRRMTLTQEHELQWLPYTQVQVRQPLSIRVLAKTTDAVNYFYAST